MKLGNINLRGSIRIKNAIFSAERMMGILDSPMEWDAGHEYGEGDFASSGGILYVSLKSANKGNAPSSESAFWKDYGSSRMRSVGISGDASAEPGVRYVCLSENGLSLSLPSPAEEGSVVSVAVQSLLPGSSVRVLPGAGQTVGGAASSEISDSFGSCDFVLIGTDWRRVSPFRPVESVSQLENDLGFIPLELPVTELSGAKVTVSPILGVYSWNSPAGPCELKADGFSPSGEQWVNLYVTPAESSTITGVGLVILGDIIAGKRNYCQLKGFKGQVRLYVLEVED